MEPAIKPATKSTKCKRVGILATNGTLESAKFSALLETYSGDIKFYTQPCPGLVELIEQGHINNLPTKNLIQKYLNPFIKAEVDTIVLGCTHYIFIKNIIKNKKGGFIVLQENMLMELKSMLSNITRKECLIMANNVKNKKRQNAAKDIFNYCIKNICP